MTDPKNSMLDTTPRDKDLAEFGDIDEETKAGFFGKVFCYAALFRGEMSSQHVDEALCYLKGHDHEVNPKCVENCLRKTIGYEKRQNHILNKVKNFQSFFHRNPLPTFNTITNYAPPGLPMSVTYLRNTSQVKHKFIKIIREASRMYATGSFLHWYNPEDDPEMKILDDALKYCCEEFISEWGSYDGSAWPEQISEDVIYAEMRGQ